MVRSNDICSSFPSIFVSLHSKSETIVYPLNMFIKLQETILFLISAFLKIY